MLDFSMLVLREILIAILFISLIGAGFPVIASAGTPCPMENKQQMSSMQGGVEHCPECLKQAQEKQHKKGCCCDSIACHIKCSTVSSISMFPAMTVAMISRVGMRHQHSIPLEVALSAYLYNSQERPPKSFA